MPRLYRLIIVRRDRPETLRSVLANPGRWPPGTALMLDRRYGERRTRSQRVTFERRSRPRRAEPDPMWHTRGFVAMDTPAESLGRP